MGKSKKGTSRKKSSGAAALGLLPCLPGPNAVAGEAVDVPGTFSNFPGQGVAANKEKTHVRTTRVSAKLCIINYVMKFS